MTATTPINNFHTWISEIKDLFSENFEVREAYLPKIDWLSFYTEGLTPTEAMDRYFTMRHKKEQ